MIPLNLNLHLNSIIALIIGYGNGHHKPNYQASPYLTMIILLTTGRHPIKCPKASSHK